MSGLTVKDIRPLKRKEVKELREKGFDLAGLNRDNVDGAMDASLEMVFPGRAAEIDELPNPEVHRLFTAVIKATFGRDEEAEKN